MGATTSPLTNKTRLVMRATAAVTTTTMKQQQQRKQHNKEYNINSSNKATVSNDIPVSVLKESVSAYYEKLTDIN